MRYITHYSKFNEGVFKRNKYDLDETVKKIFTRIKDTYDHSNLKYSKDGTWNRSAEYFTYTLEESITDTGYIELFLKFMKDRDISQMDELKINDDVVVCSDKLRERIYDFFTNKIEEAKERAEKEKNDKIKNKYKDIY